MEFPHNDRIEDRNNLFNSIATGRDLLRINYGTTLDDVHTFNGTTVANVRLNFSRFREATVSYGDGFNATQLGFPAYIAAAAPKLVLPLIRFASTTAGQDYNQITSDTDGSRPFNIFQVFGDVVKIIGNHSLKIGADTREARDSNQSYGNSQGVYTFSTNWTKAADNATAAPVGQDLAAFLLGMPTSGSFDINALRTNQTKYLALFVQDDWRVRSNLSLNLGLRFEREFPNTERYNRSIGNFDSTSPSPIAAQAQAAYALKPDVLAASQFKVLGGPLFPTSSNPNIFAPQSRMFSPRIGFAWTPIGAKTVIRGGTGVFMFPINNPSYNQPGFSQATSLVASLDNFLTPYATLANPFPDGFQQPTGSSLGLATNLGKSLSYYNPTIHNPYSVRWEFSLQRELPGNMAFEMAYIGNHAVHLLMDRNMDALPARYLSTSPVRDQATIDYLGLIVTNPFAGLIPGQSLNGATVSRQTLLTPFPQFTGLTLQSTNAASSFFQSVDVRVEKRMSHGLSILSNFTYSKLIARDNYKNATDTQPEKRVAADDRPLRLVLSGSYTPPFGKGHAVDFHSGILNRIMGGWVLNGIYVNQVGAPLTFGSNLIYNGSPLNNNPHPSNLDAPIFDTKPFNTNSAQQLGSNIATFGTRYGSLRQDGAANVDLSLIKNTAITERVRLQFRFEAFNALNRPSFDPPNVTVTSTAFGKITTQPNIPRSIQMALRLAF